MQGLLPSNSDSPPCTLCLSGDAPGRRSRSGIPYVYPNGPGWQAKRKVDGKVVLYGTGDTPEQAAALLPASLRTKPASCKARGVKRKATLLPADLCEHIPQGSEEGSLSAELRAVAQKHPYRPPFSPLPMDTASHRVSAAGTSASGYIIRRGLVASQKAGGGVCSKF
jgi:hypothetical protein